MCWASDKADLERLFRLLTKRIAFLTQGGPAPAVPNPRLPPLDSGILGPEIAPDNLTITVSMGESLFDERFGLAAQKPLRLQKMTRFPNDSLDAALCHGDLLLQICANTQDTVIHALRDIIKHTPDLLERALEARRVYLRSRGAQQRQRDADEPAGLQRRHRQPGHRRQTADG